MSCPTTKHISNHRGFIDRRSEKQAHHRGCEKGNYRRTDSHHPYQLDLPCENPDGIVAASCNACSQSCRCRLCEREENSNGKIGEHSRIRYFGHSCHRQIHRRRFRLSQTWHTISCATHFMEREYSLVCRQITSWLCRKERSAHLWLCWHTYSHLWFHVS